MPDKPDTPDRPDKTAEQLRQEIATERGHLGGAVDDLRTEVDELKRKLPYVAAVAIGAGVVIGLVRRRLRR
jgi:hypothetical protein